MQAISAGRLRSVDARVYAQLVAMAATKGEAWPRTVTLAHLTGINDRLVRRALRELEARGYITSRLVDVGGELPSAKRVIGRPLRVFRIVEQRDPSRIKRSDPDRIERSDPDRIPRSAPPYEDLDPGNHLNDDDIDRDCKRSHERDGGVEEAASFARATSPTGSPVTFTPATTSDAIASSPAPDDSSVVVATGARGADRERMDERHASREASNEGGVAATPTDDRERRRAARRVLERHAELVAAIAPVTGAVCTRSLLDLVVERLADGFAEHELVELVAYAIGSDWHLQKPTRTSARFLFRNAEEVAAVLRDAAAAARKRPAKALAQKRRGVPGGGPGTDGQEADPVPVSTREQMVTGAASLAAFSVTTGGAR